MEYGAILHLMVYSETVFNLRTGYITNVPFIHGYSKHKINHSKLIIFIYDIIHWHDGLICVNVSQITAAAISSL